MQLSRDFLGGKGAWLRYRQISSKMSGGLDKADYEVLIRLVSQNRSFHDVTCIRLWYGPCWSRFFEILCTQKRCFLFHYAVFSFFKRRVSITVNNCTCTNKAAWASLEQVGAISLEDNSKSQTHTHTHTKKSCKFQFGATHMNSLLCFHRQEYRTIFAATKCHHAAPRI